jgi:carboxyl-terminal processing protease
MKRSHPTAAVRLCVLLCAAGCAAPRPAAVDLTPETRDAALRSFDQVWTTVRDRHWDPDHNGVDWEAVRDELRPRIEAARTPEDVRSVLRDMLARLGQTHFAILPHGVHAGGGDGRATGESTGADGIVGVRVRVHRERALVVRVDPGSPAAASGVHAGSIVRRVGATDVDRLTRELASAYGDAPLGPAMIALAIEERLTGPVGEAIEVELEDDAGDRRVVSLARHTPPGRRASIGHLPAMYVDFESRTLDGGAGYIRFDAFLDPPWLMTSFGDAMEQFLDAPGIVLDLRGNPGGIGAMAMGIGGWFVDEPDRRLGTMRTRETELSFVLNPRAETYGGPLAVLVDECSMSTSEILAGGLQDLGRARVFGTRTAGAALPSMIERLPNGDGFQYAFAHYTSAGGRVLEGHGVVPDVVVEPDPRALLAGSDPPLEAALAWIRDRGRARVRSIDSRDPSSAVRSADMESAR